MGVPVEALPDDSPYIDYALAISIETVYDAINQASAILYTAAVYNLAGSNLIAIAQDTPPSTYWADLRKQYSIFAFVAGVIQSAGDEGTNESMTVPDWAKELTLANLRQLKDPFGREYLAIAQSTGPLWGLT